MGDLKALHTWKHQFWIPEYSFNYHYGVANWDNWEFILIFQYSSSGHWKDWAAADGNCNLWWKPCRPIHGPGECLYQTTVNWVFCCGKSFRACVLVDRCPWVSKLHLALVQWGTVHLWRLVWGRALPWLLCYVLWQHTCQSILSLDHKGWQVKIPLNLWTQTINPVLNK